MRSLAFMCLVALVIPYPDKATGQSYPNKPVRLVTAAAGAGGDFVSRMVATGLTELWGQPVVIDNRGGSAVIPIELVAKAPPDAYTLLAFGTALWHLPLMRGAPALNALLSGETQLMIANASGAGPFVKTGRLRALAVTSAQRSALFPDIPTVAASGLPGYEASSTQCIFAPAAIPAALVNRLNQDLVRVLSRPDVKERFVRSGAEIVANSPDELATMIKADMIKIGKIIKDAGIRAD